jgi:hypothetical protein
MKLSHIPLVVLTIFFLCGSINKATAQIPNPDFEMWSGGNPNDWLTSNEFGGGITNITQTTDAHSGSSAVRGEVVDFFGFPFAPIVVSGDDGRGFPISSQQPAVHGWYKLTPLGTDSLFIVVGMQHADSSIGAGGIFYNASQSVYREFVANITYLGPQTPDTCLISAFISTSGSAVDEHGNLLPDTYVLQQNYPNPFNPSTNIQYAIPGSGLVSLRVYDMLGQEVATLVNEHQEAGSYRVEFNGEDLPSGTYFYRMQAGEFSQARTMVLVK